MGTQHATGPVQRHLARQGWVCRLWQRGKAREKGTSHSHTTLSQTGWQKREGQDMFKLNKPGEDSGYKMRIYRGDKSHLARAAYANCPFLTGSLQCPESIRHLASEKPGPQKMPPVRGFKYRVLGEQLRPAHPGPLPGWMGLVRVRER